jgi:hypothetical protein
MKLHISMRPEIGARARDSAIVQCAEYGLSRAGGTAQRIQKWQCAVLHVARYFTECLIDEHLKLACFIMPSLRMPIGGKGGIIAVNEMDNSNWYPNTLSA